MTRFDKGRGNPRAALAAAIVCGMIALGPAGAGLATPPKGGCATGCGGAGKGHDHGPSAEERRAARDSSARSAAGDGDGATGGGGTYRSSGAPGQNDSGQIGAAAAAQGPQGPDDPSAALIAEENRKALAGLNLTAEDRAEMAKAGISEEMLVKLLAIDRARKAEAKAKAAVMADLEDDFEAGLAPPASVTATAATTATRPPATKTPAAARTRPSADDELDAIVQSDVKGQ